MPESVPPSAFVVLPSARKVSVPGTCGEWMQGRTDYGRVHISAPISWRTRATIATSPLEDAQTYADTGRIGTTSTVMAERYPMTTLSSGSILIGAVRPRTQMVLDVMSQPLPPHTIWAAMDSTLPVGKGMASSSADLGAAALAYEQSRLAMPGPLVALPRRYTRDIVKIIAAIEPTDAVLYQGCNYAELDSGELITTCLLPIQFSLVVCVPELSRDSLEVRARWQGAQGDKNPLNDTHFDAFANACHTQDVVTMGQLATQSALAVQEIVPTPQFDLIMDIAKEHHALGVIVGHSGSVAGVIIPPARTPSNEAPLHHFGDQYTRNNPGQEAIGYDMYQALGEAYDGSVHMVRIDQRGPITLQPSLAHAPSNEI